LNKFQEKKMLIDWALVEIYIITRNNPKLYDVDATLVDKMHPLTYV